MKKIQYFFLRFAVFAVLTALALLPTELCAALAWKKTVINYTAKPDDESVTALFRFANVGKTPVRIAGTKTSCGCTVAEIDSSISYMPGQMGVLKVTFNFENRTGHQEKKVIVFTDDPYSYQYVLTLVTEIPQLFTIEPQLLYWESKEPLLMKSSTIKVISQAPIEIVKAECDNSGFIYHLTEVKKGREYRLDATPSRTDISMEAKVMLTTNIGKKESPKQINLLLQVY
jgi:hypothetical protein